MIKATFFLKGNRWNLILGALSPSKTITLEFADAKIVPEAENKGSSPAMTPELRAAINDTEGFKRHLDQI